MMDSDDIARLDERGTVEARSVPFRLEWELPDLITSDAHRMTASYSCGARALDAPTERRMLAETFLAAQPRATIGDVVRHFQPALHASARRAAASQTAVQWIDETKLPMMDALRETATSVAFTCGIELQPPFRLEFHSPTLEQQRLEEVRRAAAERRAAGQVKRFEVAAELMRQFGALKSTDRQISAGEWLKRIDAADQADVLHASMMSRELRTERLLAVTGNELLTIDPRSSPPKTQAITLPQELGPLRSVTAQWASIYVGARHGVIQVDPDRPAEAVLYRDADRNSPHGFSRVVRGTALWACHRDAGLVRWNIDSPAAPDAIHPPTQIGGIVRNLRGLDAMRVMFSIDATLATVDFQGTLKRHADVGSDIIDILPARDRLVVVTRDGRMKAFSSITLEPLSESRPAPSACSAALLPWMGDFRVLIAPENGEVLCVGLDDGLVTRYASAYQGVQMLCAADDLIAGVSADRQRLIVWNAWESQRPFIELHVASIAKHRIAGIAIG